jgi:hypothetical protein
MQKSYDVKGLRPRLRAVVLGPPRGSLTERATRRKPFLSARKASASGRRDCAITGPLAAVSTSNKGRVVIDLSLKKARQQTGLDFQQAAVTHPVIEQGVRDQRIHAQLVSVKKALAA